ncbi:hypothetical protein VOLCADRAFT_80444 [Volvox carteri f. nagariensis]|uniref:monodehydroascorbate reductase (NADH) n=1 Tax=Volvox carteri f. nagariensis TaxID=3068 RepID=D8TRB8_VOLCA|nr:uncharacterized protein VOLCADRAFT_80444 [Volvox carteri f. nagariensis]EFJ49863.1 hypothetical protein VOLCADRAFT_80444 [Volvox carteri f. nagariensis]|eukprot:XP_002948928.1 hypothetical protein VOLCADRAFT_80444 [Volvox carteri f. nagariensis]
MSSYKIIFLGGGNAAGYAARAFVENCLKAGELAIITEEPYVAYERPALSKGYLLGEFGRWCAARLPGFHTCVGGGGERQAPEWYSEKGITYLTNSRVVKADLANKALTLASGEVLSYEKLIIGTGARPTRLTEFGVPGADLGGLFYLRDVKDGDVLVAAVAATKEAGGKAVVIGGGYIGMEVAAGLSSSGLSVTMVFPEDRILSRLLTPQLAAVYERLYDAKGIKMVKGAKVTGFDGVDGKVSWRCGQSLDAGLVVVGVGARPNVELFQGQLEIAAGGIKVDGQMATSVPDVYAVGDVAAFPLTSVASGEVSYARQEHVTHCRLSAAQAAKAILGLSPPPYDYLPFFYSRVFALSWVFYGEAPADATAVHFGDMPEAKCFGCLWLGAGGKLVGAFLEGGSADDAAVLKAAVAGRLTIPTEEGGLGAAAGSGAAVVAQLKAKL